MQLKNLSNIHQLPDYQTLYQPLVLDKKIGNRTILGVQQIAEFDWFLTEPVFTNDETT